KNERKDHPPRKHLSGSTLLLLCSYASLLRMNEPCEPDAQNIESDHGRGIDRHIYDVCSWGQESGNYKKQEDCPTNVLKEKFGVHYAHQSGEADHDGQLEHQGQPQDDAEEKTCVLGDHDHR